MKTMLEVNRLSVAAKTTAILKDISFSIAPRETVALLGPNGAGKSTLAAALMGSPKFKITNGSIFFNNQDITNLPPETRARLGLFLSYQIPVEIPGISTADLLRTALEQPAPSKSPNTPEQLDDPNSPERTGLSERRPISFEDFETRLADALKALKLDPFFATRDLNVGLSGGERKKNEILQLLVLRPQLAILDEVDSGLDKASVEIVGRALKNYQQATSCSFLLITHASRLAEILKPTRTLILEDGRLKNPEKSQSPRNNPEHHKPSTSRKTNARS